MSKVSVGSELGTEVATQDKEFVVRRLVLFLSGFCIAFIGALCGIGGGLFTVPILHFVLGMPLRRSVATSLCLVFATTSAATVAEAFSSDSAIAWPLVGYLVLGTLIGAQLGYPISKRFDTRNLRGIFSIVIAVAAARILFGGDGGALDAGSPSAWNPAVFAGLAGFLGGFVSPILGIGGGLVTMPMLLFGPSALTFAGVRACSMATAVVTSGRSLSLYWKERTVHRDAAGPLVLGALIGATLGVTTVHMPGVVDYARSLLGIVLVLVSLRFATAWWRER